MLFYGFFSGSSDAGHIRVNVESIALDVGLRERSQPGRPQTPSPKKRKFAAFTSSQFVVCLQLAFLFSTCVDQGLLQQVRASPQLHGRKSCYLDRSVVIANNHMLCDCPILQCSYVSTPLCN